MCSLLRLARRVYWPSLYDAAEHFTVRLWRFEGLRRRLKGTDSAVPAPVQRL
jgi:hypothetical protein